MHDLSAVAEANADVRRSVSAKAIASDVSGRLSELHRQARRSQMSSNVTADRVLACHAAGEVLDARRYYVQRVGGDVEAGLAAFTTAQGEWLHRRQGFEDLWGHGRRLVYWALTGREMGAEEYGAVCLVVADPEAPPPDALAVFPSNTARRYATEAGDVDEALALTEASAWAERAEVAVLKQQALESATPSESAVGGRESDADLEVTRAGPLPVSSLGEVRLRSALAEALDEAQVERHLLGSGAANARQQEDLEAYLVLHAWRSTLGVAVVLV